MDKLTRLFAQYQVNISPLPHVDTGPGKVQAILTIVFSIVGAVSVLMVVIGGFKYIAAQGEPQELAKAKGTIIYAIVGVLVSISAVSIVTFVLGAL